MKSPHGSRLDPSGISLFNRSLLMATALVVVVGLVTGAVAMRLGSSDAAGTSAQPETPIAAGFFYPWYPSHWTENDVYPYTNYTPSLGHYSSTDSSTVAQQLELAERAHLDAFISSWWEPGETTDVSLQHILSQTASSGSPIKWATYYEREGYESPGVAHIASDLQYMNYYLFSSPAYLFVDGKPVVFAYGEGTDDCTTVDRWLDAQEQSGIDAYVVLKVFEGYTDCPSQPESWHQYSPTSHFDYQPTHSASVSPGFWKSGQGPALERDAFNFEYAVQWMAVTDTTWRLITTWNEWAEGTAVEPALEYGDTYIDILCRNLPGSTPCSASSPTLTPTPGPTPHEPTPTPTPSPLPSTTPSPATTPSLTPSPTPTPTSTPAAETASASPSPTETPAEATPKNRPPRGPKHGDIDCSESVTSLDALQILRGVAGMTQVTQCDGSTSQVSGPHDVNCDGSVDALDALWVLRFVAGETLQASGGCPEIGS